MIKSVLFSIQMYWSQMLVLPKAVIKHIDVRCRTFLCTGDCTESKTPPAAWEDTHGSKAQGGLNVFLTHSFGIKLPLMSVRGLFAI